LLNKKANNAVVEQSPAVESVPSVSGEHAGTRKPSLIEFPGINRNALPEWRKELSERVREKQERRAREAVLEAQSPATTTVETQTTAPPILELLPQTELPPLNPIVEAALKRIERAHLQSSSLSHGNVALAAALAHEEQQGLTETETGSSLESSALSDIGPTANIGPTADLSPVEKVHNLSVVPKPAVNTGEANAIVKPKRLIGETNDPALNYLDTVPTGLLVETRAYVAASTTRRCLAAIIDLAIVVALASPLLALSNLTSLDWHNPRVIAFSAGSFMLGGFLYLTILTAFTGRTLGMRLCSLRVVDARNGLIPTGGQSAARAFIYMLSLASAGCRHLIALCICRFGKECPS